MAGRRDPTIEERWQGDTLDLEMVEDLKAFFARRRADPLFGINVPDGYVEDDEPTLQDPKKEG